MFWQESIANSRSTRVPVLFDLGVGMFFVVVNTVSGTVLVRGRVHEVFDVKCKYRIPMFVVAVLDANWTVSRYSGLPVYIYRYILVNRSRFARAPKSRYIVVQENIPVIRKTLTKK